MPVNVIIQEPLEADCNCPDCMLDRARDEGFEHVDENGDCYHWCEGDEGNHCYDCYSPCSAPDPEDDYPPERIDHYDEASRERELLEISVQTVPDKIRDNASGMFVPDIPGRLVRPISFEQEIAYGRNLVARQLAENHWSPSEEVYSYGSSGYVNQFHRDYGTFVHVERDSSCGGEIIYSKIRLNDEEKAAKFENALLSVRDLIHGGDAEIDMHCGFHIHIDLGPVKRNGFVTIPACSMHAVENIYHVHRYLEDFFYRIGASRWSAHRTEINTTDYALLIPKGLKGRAQVGHELNYSENRYGLNLKPYLSSRAMCNCGAFEFAAWEECTCNLNKPTVEFRWPNATANPRKIHAFSALLLGLVELCRNAEAGEFAELPTNPFRNTRDYPEPNKVIEWLTWIGDRIPMTRVERRSLAYCLNRGHFAPPESREEAHFAQYTRNLPYEDRELRLIG